MTSPQNRALARLAVEKKLVSREAMDEALRESERPGGRDPWAILVSRGVLAPRDVLHLRSLTAPTIRDGAQSKATLPTPGPRSASGRPTPRPSSPAAPTYVFGEKYELLEELGSGGMGVVFRARDTRLQRDVAIKLVDLGPRPSADMVERFEREARTTARLRHPAVVPVHDFGEFNGRHFLVMDVVHGKTLGERIEKKDLSLRDAVAVVRAVAEGIAHAHAEGIIHRDLKPDNVLVDQAGRGFVTDFGLAKETGTRSGLTKTGMAIGTAVYMSPEAAAGELRSVGPCSDVYGLGTILYEVLAGEPPFSGETTVQIIASVITKDPVPPSRIRPDAPRDLEVVCLKAMQKEPSHRYPSAQEFADELGRWQAGEPIRARPSGMVATMFRKFRRGRPWLAGAAALLAMAAGVLGVVLWKADREKARRDEAASFFHQGLGRSQTSGGLREAIGLFDRALAIRPDYTEALLSRGIAKHQLGDAQGATDDLERAVALDPTSSDAWYHLGRAACEVPNRRKRSKDAFQRLLEVAPSYKLAPLARARLAWLEGDLVQAARLCDDAEKALGSDEDVHFLRGGIAADEGDSRAAIEHYTKGLQVRPESWRCLVNRACEHLTLGERDRALVDIDRAIQLNPDRPEAWAKRAFCLIGMGRVEEAKEALARIEALPPAPGVPVGYVRAQVLGELGRYDEALAALAPVLEESPRDAKALVARARIQLALGRLPLAVADAAKAVDAAPSDSTARTYHAELLILSMRWEEAEKQIGEVLSRNPDVPAALALRARVRMKRADRSGARADLERALQLSPADKDVALQLGQLLIDAGESEAARKVFEEVLRNHPGHPDATMALGLMEVEGGRLKSGFARLAQVLAENPGFAEIQANAGSTLARLGAKGLGLAYLDRAVAIDPDCDLALHNRALVRVELGDLEGALVDLDQAIKIAENPSGARCARAEVLWKKGDVPRALEEVERAVLLDPQAAYPPVVRVLLLAADGKLKRAAEEAEALLKKEGADARLLLVRAEWRLSQGDRQGAVEDLFGVISATRNEDQVILANQVDLPPADWERIDAAVMGMRDDAELGGAARSIVAAFLLLRGRPAEAKALLEEAVAGQPEDSGAIELLVQAHVDVGSYAEAASLLDACAKKVLDPDEARVIQLWQEQLAPLRAPSTTREDKLRRIDALLFWERFGEVVRECSQGISEIERNPTGAGLEKVVLGRLHVSHATAALVLATRATSLNEHQANWNAASAHVKKAIELGGLTPAEMPEDAILQLLLSDIPTPR